MGKLRGAETNAEGENYDLEMDKTQEHFQQDLQDINTANIIKEKYQVLSKIPYKKEEITGINNWKNNNNKKARYS